MRQISSEFHSWLIKEPRNANIWIFFYNGIINAVWWSPCSVKSKLSIATFLVNFFGLVVCLPLRAPVMHTPVIPAIIIYTAWEFVSSCEYFAFGVFKMNRQQSKQRRAQQAFACSLNVCPKLSSTMPAEDSSCSETYGHLR